MTVIHYFVLGDNKMLHIKYHNCVLRLELYVIAKFYLYCSYHKEILRIVL